MWRKVQERRKMEASLFKPQMKPEEELMMDRLTGPEERGFLTNVEPIDQNKDKAFLKSFRARKSDLEASLEASLKDQSVTDADRVVVRACIIALHSFVRNWTREVKNRRGRGNRRLRWFWGYGLALANDAAQMLLTISHDSARLRPTVEAVHRLWSLVLHQSHLLAASLS